MKLRIVACGLVCAASLCGQHRFSWQDACFKNPAAPYCPGHDFAIKPTPLNKAGVKRGGSTYPEPSHPASDNLAPSLIVVGNIDWRFADPSADALAGVNSNRLSPLARSFIAQLGAGQGLHEADMRKIFEGLSSVGQVALSVHEDRIVLMVTGRATDSTVPTLEVGWKAMPIAGNAILIGPVEAVEEAAERISTEAPLSELARMAGQRQPNSEFWAVAPSQLAGPKAVTAGAKRFSLTLSMQDRLISDTAFEFKSVPDASTIHEWMSTLEGATIEDNMVHVRMSMEASEARQRFGQIAGSPLGQSLAALIQCTRYLPVHDAAMAAHTKPVIYGLDEGSREVKQ